jgi:hypothetical protein
VDFHPEPLTESLDLVGSCHRAKAAAFRCASGSSRRAAWPMPNGGGPLPSLQEHFTRFVTATGRSAPVRRALCFALHSRGFAGYQNLTMHAILRQRAEDSMPLDVLEAVAPDGADSQGIKIIDLMVKALQRDDPLRRLYLQRRWHGHREQGRHNLECMLLPRLTFSRR